MSLSSSFVSRGHCFSAGAAVDVVSTNCDLRHEDDTKLMYSRYQEEPRRLDRPIFFWSIRRLAARKVREDCLLGPSD